MKPARKNALPEEQIALGTFTRKEAGKKVALGFQHVHSQNNCGKEDACARATEKAITSGKVAVYPWEENKESQTAIISSSNSRYEVIPAIAAGLKLKHKRGLRERVESVLEELITNAIYHAYTRKDGDEKYERKNVIQLEKSEVIKIKYFGNRQGYFISVKDCGGSMEFSDLEKSFGRCYGSGSYSQIDSKESGAGLGMYLIFEAVTHVKVVCKRGVSTTITVWISDEHPAKPENFSFNFFEEE